MIEESKANAGELAIEWHTAAYDESGLPAGEFDAVTAMGLIEYLPDDDGLFAEAARLLRPGGRFAVSCRNRLYNLLSANDYTAQELGEEAPRLLEELRDHLARTEPAELHALAESLAASAEDLERAAAADRDVPPKELHDHRRAFQRGQAAAHAARPRAGCGAARLPRGGAARAASASAAARARAARAADVQPPRRRVAAGARALAGRARLLDRVRRGLRARLTC